MIDNSLERGFEQLRQGWLHPPQRHEALALAVLAELRFALAAAG